MIRTSTVSFSGMMIDGRPATDLEKDIAIMLCMRTQLRDVGGLTKSEQRRVEGMLKRPGTSFAKMDVDLSQQEFRILLQVAYRYRRGMDATTILFIALKGGVPAEHPEEAKA